MLIGIHLQFKLLYVSTEYVQDLELTIDSGYIETGVSFKSEKREYFSAEFSSLTDEKERHDASRMYRRNRRSRLRYREPRFNDRTSTKQKWWIPPSLQHKIDTQISVITKICQFAPVIRVVIEVGQYSSQTYPKWISKHHFALDLAARKTHVSFR